MTEDLVADVLADWRTAPVSPQYRAMLAYLKKLTLTPADIGPEDIAALRQAGLTDGAIMEAAVICFIFSVINRLADAFGFDLPTDAMRKTGARLIRIIGYGPATEKTSSPE